MLIYRAKAVLPIEVMEPTRRWLAYEQDANEEAMRLALDFLPEIRGNALLKMKI